MLEMLAAQRGEPSAQQYMDGVGLDDVQHAISWQQISDYLRTVNVASLTKHVPLLGSKHSVAQSESPPPAFPKTSFDLLV